MTQPKAIALAEVLEAEPRSAAHHDAAAAELRRLHAQRDALLEALKKVTTAQTLSAYGMALHNARAAIKAVEENT